jgi:hypothetical protein
VNAKASTPRRYGVAKILNMAVMTVTLTTIYIATGCRLRSPSDLSAKVRNGAADPVTWELVVPPLSQGASGLEADVGAPLSRWDRLQVFTSESSCRSARLALILSAPRGPIGYSANGVRNSAALCVVSRGP